MNILVGFKLHTKIKFKNWILQVWVVRERVDHSPLNYHPKKGGEGRMVALSGWSPPSHSVRLQHLLDRVFKSHLFQTGDRLGVLGGSCIHDCDLGVGLSQLPEETQPPLQSPPDCPRCWFNTVGPDTLELISSWEPPAVHCRSTLSRTRLAGPTCSVASDPLGDIPRSASKLRLLPCISMGRLVCDLKLSL